MKKIIVGLALMSSISAYASTCTYEHVKSDKRHQVLSPSLLSALEDYGCYEGRPNTGGVHLKIRNYAGPRIGYGSEFITLKPVTSSVTITSQYGSITEESHVRPVSISLDALDVFNEDARFSINLDRYREAETRAIFKAQSKAVKKLDLLLNL